LPLQYKKQVQDYTTVWTSPGGARFQDSIGGRINRKDRTLNSLFLGFGRKNIVIKEYSSYSSRRILIRRRLRRFLISVSYQKKTFKIMSRSILIRRILLRDSGKRGKSSSTSKVYLSRMMAIGKKFNKKRNSLKKENNPKWLSRQNQKQHLKKEKNESRVIFSDLNFY